MNYNELQKDVQTLNKVLETRRKIVDLLDTTEVVSISKVNGEGGAVSIELNLIDIEPSLRELVKQLDKSIEFHQAIINGHKYINIEKLIK